MDTIPEQSFATLEPLVNLYAQYLERTLPGLVLFAVVVSSCYLFLFVSFFILIILEFRVYQ